MGPKEAGQEDTDQELERARSLTEGRRLSMLERQELWLAKKAEKAEQLARLKAEKQAAKQAARQAKAVEKEAQRKKRHQLAR